MKFVLDTSVTMRWVFGDGSPQDRDYARKILDALDLATAIVPTTWALEVANVIARAEAKDGLQRERSNEFIDMLENMDISADDATFEKALFDTLQLARKYKLSSYDASYLELAMRLELPMATLDADLRKAAKKAGVKDVV